MKAQATNGRAAGKIIRCMLAALLVAAAVFAGLPSRSQAAYAADGSLSDATWEEVKGGIEDLMGTPYVWGGKGTSGWDCSGFVGWVIANVYGLSWPGGSPGNCGTDAIAAFCAAHETFRGSSADDYNAAFAAGTVKPGDVIVFSNASGATVHCAIAGEGATVYHAWSEHFGTCNVRFDYMWGIDGGHGKTYASFAVYRGLSEGGFVTLDKTSADASVTAGNGEYTLAGAVYGVYQGGSLVAQFTTDESGHGQTSEKLPNGDYVVREISAPAGYALSQEEFHVTVAGGNVHVNAQDAPVTVNLTLIKKDAETLLPEPQGAASLDGAEYEATYLHGGEYVTAKGVVENSKLAFEGIPLGTVTIKETKAPAGYLPDPEAHEITVTADMAGSESPVFEHEVADELTEQVIRGDLKLVKVGEGDQGRMAGVPFLVTSATTGESHTIVTDANGDLATQIETPETLWDACLASASEILTPAGIPLAAVRGNHENRGVYSGCWSDFFPTPTGETYYTFRRGPVFFLVLDGCEDKPDSDIRYYGLGDWDAYRQREAAWLKEVVRSEEFRTAPVRIVLIHMIPGGEASWYGEQQIRQLFVPELVGKGIDLMLCGHYHRYQWIDDGSRGVDFPILVNSNNDCLRVSADPKGIDLKVIDTSGAVIERHRIDKK